jgi:hypothetical protein
MFASINATPMQMLIQRPLLQRYSSQNPPDLILQRIDWEAIWILFLAYAIPGVVLKIIYLFVIKMTSTG